MSDLPIPPMPDDPEDAWTWEEWPAKRAELLQAVDAMRQQLEQVDRPELEDLRRASAKFMRDIQSVIDAGDAEYRRLYPGATFNPS